MEREAERVGDVGRVEGGAEGWKRESMGKIERHSHLCATALLNSFSLLRFRQQFFSS